MANFPPFYKPPYHHYYGTGYPNFYNRNYKNTSNNNAKNSNIVTTDSLNISKHENITKDEQKINNEKTSRYNSFGPIYFQNPFSIDSENPVLEILGLNLYLDDIIILGLLFFLYKEGVQDEMLFLALILLLIS